MWGSRVQFHKVIAPCSNQTDMAGAKEKVRGFAVNIKEHEVGSNQQPGSMTGSSTHLNLKYFSLLCLVLQNAVLILTMRYTRNLPGNMYFSTVAVVVTEVVKLITCLFILLFQSRGNVVELGRVLWGNIVLQPWDTLKVSVPAFIYTIQNNLLFVAVSNLSAATFQVTYQLKILTTALFTVVMLRRSLASFQWVALLLLFVGVAIVQIQPTDPTKRAAEVTHTEQNPMHGLIAVIIACSFSGFAGVYFEKILKGSKTSIWLRNIQLGMFGSVIGLITMALKDGQDIAAKGMFFGFTPFVVGVICLQAFGGLLVAVVVKYADNILKGFATSFSIIISTIVAVYIFHFKINIQFCVGAGLVILAIFIYGRPKPKEKPTIAEQPLNGVTSK